MGKNRVVFWLSILVIILVWFSVGMGLFYSDGGQPRTVENIYGVTIQLFGDGVYANNSMLKATTAKGSDLVMLLASLGLLATTLKRDTRPRTRLLHGGFLVSIFYYSVTTSLGIVYSRMFLVYLSLFSAAFFAMVASMIDLNKTIHPIIKDKNFTGTAIFTILAGCTVLVWLMSILPTVFSDTPLDIIEIYTTEPTFVIDIGLILPVCVLGGVMLLQRKPLGYIIPPVMLTFLVVIAVSVISQTAMQLQYGVVVPIQKVIGYVTTFVMFGIIAAVVNTFFLHKCWPKSK